MIVNETVPQQFSEQQVVQQVPQQYQDSPQQFYSDPNQLYDANGMPMFQSQQQTQPHGAVFPNSDQGFLKWLFSFTTESLDPLENHWQGKVLTREGNWVYPKGKPVNAVMNQEGVSWAISLLRSYFNPVFFVTSMNERNYNFRMREASNFILYNLYYRHEEFGIKTTDIPRVAEEIESKIAAIMSGALENGYRIFLSTQNQNIETRNLTAAVPMQSSNIFSKMSNSLFKKDTGGQQW